MSLFFMVQYPNHGLTDLCRVSQAWASPPFPTHSKQSCMYVFIHWFIDSLNKNSVSTYVPDSILDTGDTG